MCFFLLDTGFVIGGDATGLNNEETRAKTAPLNKRKSWSHKAVELRVAEGKSIHVEVPGEGTYLY